ncbi:MAG: hypothetical protein H6595_01595 [Flavobacteriales bacterium]|nr:hypothetical protein [Flavobacteriales bacterium]MCB9166154.1 hypothetical protein [Flavobacteriales bacterium]
MKNLSSYIFPGLLILAGGILLIMGAMEGQNTWVMLGSGLALVVGVIMLLLQLGRITRRTSMLIGLLSVAGALFLAFRDYRSVKSVLEFEAMKKANDTQVIQGLKDIRTAELGYKQATGGYTSDLSVLHDFVKSGTIPMVRAIGQKPDTLSVEEAIELGIIVRDTIQVPAMDSLFMTKSAQQDRAFAFDAGSFTNSPTSKKPFLLKAGVINSSGRNVPVFQAKDPAPLVAGDTLMVGSLEKASTSGNWTGE